MHYALEVVPFGDYANPRNVVPLAQATEQLKLATFVTPLA